MLINSKAKIQNSKVNGFWKVLFFIAYCLLPIASQAQCAMCRASLESEGNTAKAEAVNDGIVYLMVIPYILVGVVAIVVYRMYSKKKAE
ncbi:hypothetical protein [Flavobacterium sp.]|uniref:hypothetical protein n=1 Tax=Flavobacterium sp. TaxID=239 RepID=UPI0037536CB8